MLISTKGRYALRTMIDLALNGDGEPVKIKDIAKRQDISGADCRHFIKSRVCAQHPGKSGRVLSFPACFGIYGGNDSESYRRQLGSGGLLVRGRKSLRQTGRMRYFKDLAGAGRSDCRGGEPVYAGGFDPVAEEYEE